MSEILKPSAFKAEVGALVAELIALTHQYEDGHDAAFSPQVVDTVSVTTGHSDVPYAQAGQKESLKGELRSVCEMIRKFRTGHKGRDGRLIRPGVEQQLDYLTSALEGSEHRHGLRFDPVRNPRSLSADGSEHARLLEAQRRRRERGETA